MGVSQKPIVFDSGLTLNSSDRDMLSPGWFELAAKRLLQEVKTQQKVQRLEAIVVLLKTGHLHSAQKGHQLVFFGESLGGIIVKRVSANAILRRGR